MNKDTIYELVKAYKNKTAEALHAEVLKETLAATSGASQRFVEAMDAVLVATQDIMDALKDGCPIDYKAFGYRSPFGFTLNQTGQSMFTAGINQIVRTRIYSEDALANRMQDIGKKFDKALVDISRARSVKRLKEILVAIGLPEIEVDDPTSPGGVDYEFVRNAITQLKALPAPENGGA
jgi:hypothetical protein